MVDTVSLTVALGAPVPITTGAAPVDADSTVQLYAITTGGTGGDEYLNLPNPDLVDGFNGDQIGRRVVFYVAEQTDPADVVKITVDGETGFFDAFGVFPSEYYSDISLPGVGSAICFVWQYEQWAVDAQMTRWDFVRNTGVTMDISGGTITNDSDSYGPPALVTGGNISNASNSNNAQRLLVRGGNVSSGSGNGGKLQLNGGNAQSGVGGDIEINPGSGVGGFGKIMTTRARWPTADPHVSGQWWLDGNVPTISAG